MPPGQYDIHGKFKVIPFIEYELPELPTREKLYTVPKLKDIKIIFVDGLSHNGKSIKGRIAIAENLIHLNSSLLNSPSAQLYAVLFHELGHYRYYTEYKCDIYSIRRMLEYGFNPSQMKSFLSVLKNSNDRKNIIMQTAKKADRENRNSGNRNSIRLGNLFRI